MTTAATPALGLRAPGRALAGALARHPSAERALVVLALGVLWRTGYDETAARVDPWAARPLATPLDDAIPFLPWAIYLYGLAYAVALYPFFLVRSRALLARITLAYVVVLGASFAAYALLPASSVSLRPPPEALDVRTLEGWCVRLLYATDPPTNQCPSLHVGLATIGALGAWRASRRWGAPALLLLGTTLFSVVVVKQHFVLDAAAALALAATVHHVVVGPFRPTQDERLTYDWRGPTALLACQLALYGGLALAYALEP